MDDKASPVSGINVKYDVDYGGAEIFTKLRTANINNKNKEN